jgi:hypothetical protein
MVRKLAESISQSTPMSIALAIALCGGAYVIGQDRGRSSVSLEVLQLNTTQLQALTEEVKEISIDNKRRLDLLEARIK